jgi:hypothetical protein
MPYINQINREKLQPIVNVLEQTVLTDGELNYMITKLCNIYLKYNTPNYSTMNNIIGVLECAKQEFYRKVCSPYEDQKSKDNGNVY